MTNGRRNEVAVAHAARCFRVVREAHQAVNDAAVRHGLRKRRLSKVSFTTAPVG